MVASSSAYFEKHLSHKSIIVNRRRRFDWPSRLFRLNTTLYIDLEDRVGFQFDTIIVKSNWKSDVL